MPHITESSSRKEWTWSKLAPNPELNCSLMQESGLKNMICVIVECNLLLRLEKRTWLLYLHVKI